MTTDEVIPFVTSSTVVTSPMILELEKINVMTMAMKEEREEMIEMMMRRKWKLTLTFMRT